MKKFIIFSDSHPCLEGTRNLYPKNPIIRAIRQEYTETKKQGKDVVLCWVPSHIGIEGNEAADTAAKNALRWPVGADQMPYTDIVPMAKAYVKKSWQRSWAGEAHNKLRAIRPTIKPNSKDKNLTRSEQVKLTRLRTGHTKLTHRHLLKGEVTPVCQTCNTPLSVKHLMLHCQETRRSRKKFLKNTKTCLLYTSPSPRDKRQSRMPSSA